jgi:hypothetical protein
VKTRGLLDTFAQVAVLLVSAVDVDLAACGSAGVELFAAWERVTALDAPLDFVPASAPPLDASLAPLVDPSYVDEDVRSREWMDSAIAATHEAWAMFARRLADAALPSDAPASSSASASSTLCAPLPPPR